MPASTSSKSGNRWLAAASGRSRSFGGCATCRIRHTKCDEAQPACSICKTAGLTCGGYAKNIFFDFEHAAEGENSRFRRPLLTEQERKLMSESLVSSISPRKVFRELQEIDELCENLNLSQAIQISRGPFGAFQIVQAAEMVNNTPESGNWTSTKGHVEVMLDLGNEYPPFSENALDMSPFTQQSINPLFDSDIQPFASSTLDFLNFVSSPPRIQEITDNDFISADPGHATNHYAASSTRSQSSNMFFNRLRNVQNFSLLSSLEDGVPQDAVFLLKHYSTTVLKLLTPFRHSKTPWHVLFIPHVKSCLAAITLGEEMDHASLCTFYGTLAISAVSLGGITQSIPWLDQGRLYHQRARNEVRLMLKTAYNTPKTAKYKSIVMALLTMVQASMVLGDHDQTECYLVECEKFIRVKGLNRKKSRKVRLLHHCYAYERMFHESLLASGRNSLHRQHVRKAIESCGADIHSADKLSFRLGDWSNLEEDMLKVKGPEESENDLHLEIPGEWPNTMYPEIFGVPEPYLLLLSMVIRLGREKDYAATSETGAMDLKDFVSRAKSVEKCIKQVKISSAEAVASLQPHISHHVLINMLDAMQQALTIYFYRRIYDIDASMLQDKVVAIRDCLLRFESSDFDDNYGSVRLVWPAFIAAREADDPEVQLSFDGWFETAGERSGLKLFKDAMVKAKLHRDDNFISEPGTVPHLHNF